VAQHRRVDGAIAREFFSGFYIIFAIIASEEEMKEFILAFRPNEAII